MGAADFAILQEEEIKESISSLYCSFELSPDPNLNPNANPCRIQCYRRRRLLWSLRLRLLQHPT